MEGTTDQRSSNLEKVLRNQTDRLAITAPSRFSRLPLRGFAMVAVLRSALRVVAPLVTFALVDVTHGAAQTAGPGSAARLCQVVNETQATRFSPDRGAVLAAAIAAASAGDRLEIT